MPPRREACRGAAGAVKNARTVTHHHKHPKPMSRAALINKILRNATATGHPHKHHKAHKHHTAAKKHKGAVKRGLAIGDAVACCAAEALAASLRLAGHAVSDADVLALYWHTAGDPDAGATVEATLEAAWRFGLGGYRPTFAATTPLATTNFNNPLVIGVDLPGPHTVLATPGGWWSWGELHCPCEFPDAVVEEAWAVSWS